MASASEIAAKLDLVPNPEGGLYTETFRDTSIFLSKPQLPPHCNNQMPSFSLSLFFPSFNSDFTYSVLHVFIYLRD